MNRTRPVRPGSAVLRSQAGFNIVELMVALTVTMFIIAALVAVLVGSSSTSRSREGVTELQTNGRYALEQIRNDLLHSGYLGVSSLFFPDQAITASGIAVTNVCDVNTIGRLSERVWGSNDANPYSGTCIPGASYSAGDVLVIRGLDPNGASPPFSTTRVYYHSAYEGGEPFVGPTAPDFATTNKQPPYVDHELRESVYYVSPFTNAADETPLVPALYRLRLGDGPAMASELVASGVENMQLRYGVFQTDSTVRYFRADQLNPTDWDLVKSVEIWLLLRSREQDAGYVNNNTYTMGTQAITVDDGFRRLLLSSVIELRN